MKKTAMFGGSFNPVHLGHTGLVRRMAERYNLNKVYVIPTHNTPLKDNTPMLDPLHRYNMCRLAFEGYNNVEVSDIEIQRQGESYTVDTLKELAARDPDCDLYLIIGADSFFQLKLWHQVEEIFNIATILTVSRDDLIAEKLYNQKKIYEDEFNARIEISEEPIMNVSSTLVRNLIKEGKDFTHLLPEGVSDYIQTNGLYCYE